MFKTHRTPRVLNSLLILVLFLAAYLPASARTPEPPGPESLELELVAATDVTTSATLPRGQSNVSAELKTLAASGEVQDDERSIYIIRLEAPPVASYEGGIAGLEATSPRATGDRKLDINSLESVAYTKYLDRNRDNFINVMNQALGREVDVVYEYYAALNGLAVELTLQEALVVAGLPNVSFIEPDKEFELHTNAGPAWIGAESIWDGTATGGLPGTMGEGVIVGVIDTGINPDHPSFADVGGDGYDHTNPFGPGTYVGVCDPGDPSYDPTFPCNDKLIGAWGYPTVNGGDPTDPDGHGSHTASTAAGNVVLGATVNTDNGYVVTDDISGVAPHANVIAYAACCTGAALAAARDQVVIDGVDAVNYSIGSPSPTPDPWGSSFALQWLAVRDAGIFVATSAGNDGNGFATVGSPNDLPWMTAVGASTHDLTYLNSLINMSGGDTTPPADITGRGPTVGYGPASIVYAGDYGDALCASPFSAGTFSGEIVVCDRGGAVARKAKGENVLAGGAGGMVLAEVNPAGGIGGVLIDTHVLPVVHIATPDGNALRAWLASGTGHVATIAGATMAQGSQYADIMTEFSSRGMNRALPDIVKPDVTAPGVGIMAAYLDGIEYDIIQGTSMSSPFVAGAGALLKALHPDWTPAEIESALMSTAFTGVLDDDGVTAADPFAMGAGRVDLSQAGRTGLLLNETTAGFLGANPAEGGDPSALNLASMGQGSCVGSCSWTRTVENVLSTPATWTASATGDAGLSLSVSPSSFTLNAGETQEIVVTADLSGVAEGEWVFGQVILTEDGALAPDVHLPVATRYSAGSLPDSVEIVTRRNAGSQLADNLQAIEVTDLTITVHGLVKGDVTEEYLVSDPTNGDPYDGGFDPAVDGTFFINVNVPAGTKSLIAETIFSESSDLDLFVGSGNTPNAGSQLCSSTSPVATEFCELADPTPGTYWVLVQNWSTENGPTPPGQLSTLVTAVVPDADSGNMSVAGPSSVPANQPFDVRVFWDTPSMAAGDRWYGSFELGSDAGNPGNIGSIPVTILRVEDDVTKTVDATEAKAGDVLTFEITVQPNVTPEDLAYEITDTIPDGLTYVEGSATASTGVVNVVGNELTWTGVMAVPEIEYLMTTSADDPLCDTGFGGYVDLELFGILAQSGITGDTVAFTAFSTGDPINYYGVEYVGMGFVDDGFAIFDPANNYGGAPWLPQSIPDAELPNNVLAAFWQDFEIFYDAASNAGVSLATSGAPGGWVIVEYDDIQPWGGGDPVMDFEIVVSRSVDNTPGFYEIVYAYDNINYALPATIGVEDAAGVNGVALVNNGDTSGVISNGFMVCFDQVGAADPAVITYQATVDSTAYGILTNAVVHNTDNPGSKEAGTSVDVEVATTIYVSSNTGGKAGGVWFADEDILAYDTVTGTWTKYFDGSDVGQRRADVDAFALLDDDSILMSFDRYSYICGLGWVDDSDIVKFVPTSLGNYTAGSFEWYFDGSDVGLTRSDEGVDAIGFAPDGRLVVSTSGRFRVSGVSGNGEDMIVFDATSLGADTSGTWEKYFDGSDVGLRNWRENVWGTWIDSDSGAIYLTTRGWFSVSGVSGSGADIFVCDADSLGDSTSCTFSPYWDGSAHGFARERVDSFAIGR